MISNFNRNVLLAIFSIAVATGVHAQNFTVTQFCVGGGVGISSGAATAGGPYALSGTAGQVTAVNCSGGTFSLMSGFWAADMPGALPLSALGVTRVGQSLVFSWSVSGGPYTLQSKPNISPATPWTSVSQTPVLSGDHDTVNVPMNKPAEFFRLVKSP